MALVEEREEGAGAGAGAGAGEGEGEGEGKGRAPLVAMADLEGGESSSRSSPAPSAVSKRHKHFEIKKWNAVSLWAWGAYVPTFILISPLHFIFSCVLDPLLCFAFCSLLRP